MNTFGFTDYEKPIGKKNDYRTSYYRSHIFLDDATYSKSKQPYKFACQTSEAKAAPPHDFVTEQRKNFTPKASDVNAPRNPSLTCYGMKLMKPYEETHLRQTPKPIQELGSVYKNDFKFEEKVPFINPVKAHSQHPISASEKISIDPAKTGYAKYFDTMATTSRLDYVPYTQDQIGGIGAKDTITIWNWINQGGHGKKDVCTIREQMCEKVPAAKCTKRRNEFRNLTKPVPNFGLTTESMRSYPEHLNRIDFKPGVSTIDLITCGVVQMERNTESSIYGSGESVKRFVNISSKSRGL